MFKSFVPAALAALSLCLVFSCKQEPAYEQTEEIGPYTVSLIEKDVWHVEDCNSSNPHGTSIKEDGSMSFNNCSDMYIIRGKDKAVLIDLSNKITWAEDADKALRQIFYDRAGDREKSILITHNHPDHVGMLYAFENEQDVTFILPEKDFANDKAFPEGRKSLIGDKGIIGLGGMTLETVEVPGHTPGSIVTFIKGHDIAFSGDAIGSGSGVWIFSMDSFLQYTKGVANLSSYVHDPANGIKTDNLVFWGGHFWQKGDIEKLDYQYLLDMCTLIEKMGKDEIEPEAYTAAFPYLNANFKYGIATITWNAEDGKAYADSFADHSVD